MSKIVSGNTVIISGRAKMAIPSGGAHVRAVEVFLPERFKGRPTIVATLQSPDSTGNCFVIWNIGCNDLGGQTQIVIHASSMEGRANDFEFWCDYMIMGELIKK